MASSSTASSKSVVSVSSIAVCGIISACSTCLCRYWLVSSKDSPDFGQYAIHCAPYWKNTDTQMDATKEGLLFAQLGQYSVFGGRDPNVHTGPESLTRCGHEKPTRVLECIPGLLAEVRSVVAFFSLVAYRTSTRRSFWL